MTAKEAQNLTGLSTRENPNAYYDYLRCILGEHENVQVHTSAFKKLTVPVFRLVVCAATWDRAVELWEKKQSAKSESKGV